MAIGDKAEWQKESVWRSLRGETPENSPDPLFLSGFDVMTQSILSWAICLLLLASSCHRTAQKPAGAETDASQPFNNSTTPDIVTADPDFDRLGIEDFQAFQSDDGTWSEEGNMLICSGVPKGYLFSKQSYRNFTFRGEYQFVLTEEQKNQSEKANTGFMIAIQPPQQIWPVSLEVQGRYDLMGSINTNGGLPRVKITDAADVRERVRLPIDQWNTIEIVMQDGKITSRLNGEVVCTSEATALQKGPIGLQSEGYVVRFRNVRIRRDPDDETAPKEKTAPSGT